MNRLKSLNQQGAVALISVVIFITIIIIVVSAYLTSALSQQKISINFDMGTRAYYAAESGIQDAVRAVQNNPSLSNKDNCKPLKDGLGDNDGTLGMKSNANNYGLSYTCQIIDSVPSAVSGKIQPNGTTAMLHLLPDSGAQGPFQLKLQWSAKPVNIDPTAPNLVPRANDDKSLPPIDAWQSNSGQFNAMVRLNVISHPLGSFSRSNITQNVSFLNPASSEDSLAIDKNSSLSQDNTVSNAECSLISESTSYACSKSITLNNYDFASDALYVRLGALYRATDFKIQMTDKDGKYLALNSIQATIDVTGKASNVYRRVRQAFPIKGGYFEDSTPDAALIAGDGICKLFSITNNASEFQNSCLGQN